jgi:hypothetical protein
MLLSLARNKSAVELSRKRLGNQFVSSIRERRKSLKQKVGNGRRLGHTGSKVGSKMFSGR